MLSLGQLSNVTPVAPHELAVQVRETLEITATASAKSGLHLGEISLQTGGAGGDWEGFLLLLLQHLEAIGSDPVILMLGDRTDNYHNKAHRFNAGLKVIILTASFHVNITSGSPLPSDTKIN